MGNIIELHNELTFGKHKGDTGAELLKSAKGTDYLKWVFNNTDIQIDSGIVNTLSQHGIIDRNIVRLNSLDRNKVVIEPSAGGNLSDFSNSEAKLIAFCQPDYEEIYLNTGSKLLQRIKNHIDFLNANDFRS